MMTNKAHRWGSPDTILLATNLADAPHLVPHAIAQAKLSGAKVLLVHVIKPPYLQTNLAEGLPFVLPGPTLRSAKATMNRLVKQFQQEGVLCEPIAMRGLPVEQILALLTTRDVDRVIVGTRSAGPLERVLSGSVAEELLHVLPMPVCVIGPHVRPPAGQDRAPGSVLFAASLGAGSMESAKLAFELAELNQAHLTLLHVVDMKGPDGDLATAARKAAADQLSDLVTEEVRLWCTPAVTVREGEPSQQILAEARDLPADLIVLGATTASALSRLLATGVVHRVIAEARCPVYVLRQLAAVQSDVAAEHRASA